MLGSVMQWAWVTIGYEKIDVEMSKLVPKRARYTEDNRDDNLTSTKSLSINNWTLFFFVCLWIFITEFISNKLKILRADWNLLLKDLINCIVLNILNSFFFG